MFWSCQRAHMNMCKYVCLRWFGHMGACCMCVLRHTDFYSVWAHMFCFLLSSASLVSMRAIHFRFLILTFSSRLLAKFGCSPTLCPWDTVRQMMSVLWQHLTPLFLGKSSCSKEKTRKNCHSGLNFSSLYIGVTRPNQNGHEILFDHLNFMVWGLMLIFFLDFDKEIQIKYQNITD